MNFMLAEKESFYLRRYAALQFPGSIENYSTRHPIHFPFRKYIVNISGTYSC